MPYALAQNSSGVCMPAHVFVAGYIAYRVKFKILSLQFISLWTTSFFFSPIFTTAPPLHLVPWTGILITADDEKTREILGT